MASQRLESERCGDDVPQLQSASSAAIRHASDLLESQTELMALPFLVEEYLTTAEIDLGRDLLSMNALAVPGGVVLCPTYGDPDTVTPQHVRATPSFHDAPYYDNITVEWEADNGSVHRDHAQLRLLFRLVDSNRVEHLLAMVRWYKDVTSSEPDALTEYGAVRLGWEPLPTSGRHRTELRMVRPKGFYGVVGLAAIVDRPYIVQDHAKADRFHVSPFKWS